jgi:hypothetical protein
MGPQKVKTNQSASWFGMTKKNNVQKNKNTLNIYTICWSNTVVNMETSCVVVPRHASFFLYINQNSFIPMLTVEQRSTYMYSKMEIAPHIYILRHDIIKKTQVYNVQGTYIVHNSSWTTFEECYFDLLVHYKRNDFSV